MNAQDLLQHYKNVRSRIRQAAPVRPVVIEQPKPQPQPDYQNAPLWQPSDRQYAPRDRKQATKDNFFRWFEKNKDEVAPVLSLPKDAKRITEKIVRQHGLTVEQAFCLCRVAFLSECRHEVWFALVANGYGFAEIGRMFDRDHTSILHGARKWRNKSGRQYSDYIADPAAVARRLSVRVGNVPKSQARIEIIESLRRLGAVAAGGAGGDLPEAGEDHVGQ